MLENLTDRTGLHCKFSFHSSFLSLFSYLSTSLSLTHAHTFFLYLFKLPFSFFTCPCFPLGPELFILLFFKLKIHLFNCLSLRGRFNLSVTKPPVLDFNQQTSASHSIGWSKFDFFAFLACFHLFFHIEE